MASDAEERRGKSACRWSPTRVHGRSEKISCLVADSEQDRGFLSTATPRGGANRW